MKYVPTVRTVALADLPQVEVSAQYHGADRLLTADIYFGTLTPGGLPEPLKDSSGSKYCPQLDAAFAATLVGSSAAGMVTIGGWECAGPAGPACSPAASISVDVPADFQPADAQLSVGDDSLTIPVALGDLLIARTATPVSVPDWTFQIGTQVTLQWSPSSDLSDLSTVYVAFVLPGSPVQGFSLSTGFSLGSDTLSFTVPTTPTGTGTMSIEFSGTVGGVYATETVSHSATITP